MSILAFRLPVESNNASVQMSASEVKPLFDITDLNAYAFWDLNAANTSSKTSTHVLTAQSINNPISFDAKGLKFNSATAQAFLTGIPDNSLTQFTLVGIVYISPELAAATSADFVFFGSYNAGNSAGMAPFKWQNQFSVLRPGIVNSAKAPVAGWYFFAISANSVASLQSYAIRSAANNITYDWAGSGAYIATTRNFGIGSSQDTAATGNVSQTIKCSMGAFAIYDEFKTTAQLTELYNTYKEKLANRGITI
ncbi:hypothetical protein [Acinetobacter baumannii]|uniref:hypothetical protein n=1 Tax=Acinetobacter baumannii TaxID=470 RepID=UPI003A868A8E